MHKTVSDQYRVQIDDHVVALRRILAGMEQVRLEEEDDCRVGWGSHEDCDCYHSILAETRLREAIATLDATILILRRQNWSF